jgi:DNA-binding NtrC family response regulator
MTPTLLIAEDDAVLARIVARLARDIGFTVIVHNDGESARASLKDDCPDALLTDLRLPGVDGLELLRVSKSLAPQRPMLLMTGFATPTNDIEAFELGVTDILLKPFELDQARTALGNIKSVLELRGKPNQLTPLAKQVVSQRSDAAATESTDPMRQTMEIAAQVAAMPNPVALEGETGVCKGVLARHIHAISARSEGPFFSLNCGALSPTQLVSELFGYEKGAFAGANARKPGLIEQSAGGTLFLDEFNAATPEVQSRLLQFIEEKRLFRLGGVKPFTADVRLIFAAKRPIREEETAGHLSSDLCSRIEVVSIPADTASNP